MPPLNETRAARLAAVAQRFGLADIYVFGSRADEFTPDGKTARAAATDDSDLDIAIRPLPGRMTTPDERVELTLALEELLDVSRADLVVLSEAGPFVALAAIRGNLLFAADAVDQAEYELFVLRRAGDLARFERERQEIILNGGR